MASPADIEIGTKETGTTWHCLNNFGFAIDESTWRALYTTFSFLSQRSVLMWRIALLVRWSIILIWSMVDSAARGRYKYYWTYLANWSAFVEWLYFVSVTLLSFLVVRAGVCKSNGIFQAVARASLMLGAVIPTMSSLVFLLYWTLEFTGGAVQALSVFVHGVNVLFVLADFLLTHQPYRIQHMYLAFLAGLSYISFTVIYYAATSNIVYGALDWSKPQETIPLVVVVLFIVLPALYSLWFGILYLRKCCRTSMSASDAE